MTDCIGARPSGAEALLQRIRSKTMQDDPRTPPKPRPDLKADIAKVARADDASLKAGLAKLALDEAPGTPRTGARLRNYFLTGLVVVGPVSITLYIAWNFIAMVDGWVKPYVPSIYNPDSYLPFTVPGVGLVFAVLLLTIIGALAANLLGRSLISAGELMLGRTPIVRNVYQGLKQIFESVVSASSPQQSFQKVAVMEFPAKGIWSIVFVTGEAAREIIKEIPGQDLVSVFMPTGMLPPSGFVCFVPRKNVVPIHMSVEDAAKIIISAGMVNPETQAKLRDIAERARNGKTQPAVLSVPPPQTPPAA
jgi:uncharacterized membrane protein